MERLDVVPGMAVCRRPRRNASQPVQPPGYVDEAKLGEIPEIIEPLVFKIDDEVQPTLEILDPDFSAFD